MTSQTDEFTGASAAEMREELLSRLGLPADASDRDVDTLHRAAVSLAEHAPAEQQEWAQEHLAEVEAVRSLLAETPADDVDDAAPAVRRRGPVIAWIAAALVLIAGAAFGIHLMSGTSVPGISGAPDTSNPSASAAPTVDAAQVGALMQKITSNPKDVASYTQLAALYFQAGDYKNAATFSQKVVSIDPKNTTGWLALGASQFNTGDAKSAEASWLKAVALDPKNAEAHYDLGFLYMSGDKPDLAKTKAEWQKVVAIDPTSDLAKTVKTHLDSLSSQSPSPSTSK